MPDFFCKPVLVSTLCAALLGFGNSCLYASILSTSNVQATVTATSNGWVVSNTLYPKADLGLTLAQDTAGNTTIITTLLVYYTDTACTAIASGTQPSPITGDSYTFSTNTTFYEDANSLYNQFTHLTPPNTVPVTGIHSVKITLTGESIPPPAGVVSYCIPSLNCPGTTPDCTSTVADTVISATGWTATPVQ